MKGQRVARKTCNVNKDSERESQEASGNRTTGESHDSGPPREHFSKTSRIEMRVLWVTPSQSP